MSSINHIKAREFGSLEFLAKQVVEGFITGLHKSPFHGFSVEFSEHKLYNKGESTKNIDWKLFARTDKLYVKRYEEETNLRCQIVIDASSSMYFPSDEKNNKLSFSIDAAAALIYLMRKQRDAVGLSLFSNELMVHTKPKSSISNQRFLFTELEKLMLPNFRGTLRAPRGTFPACTTAPRAPAPSSAPSSSTDRAPPARRAAGSPGPRRA